MAKKRELLGLFDLRKLLNLVIKLLFVLHGFSTMTSSIKILETIEPSDKTAVRFTWVFNNDVINKNTVVQFTWFQNSFETFETTSRGGF